MTLTPTNDCAGFTLESEFFAETNESNTLVLAINGATIHTITLPANTTESIVVDADLLEIDEFPQGVIEVSLTTLSEELEETTELQCLLLLCELHCEMAPLYTDIKNIERILAYEALKVSAGCVTCSCSIANQLYTKATTPTDAKSCNCN
jgi:hypothetical protein